MRFTEIVMERVEEIGEVSTWVDPTVRFIRSIASQFEALRGTISSAQHLYLWDAWDGTHYLMRRAINEFDPCGGGDFVITKDRTLFEAWTFDFEIAPGVFFGCQPGALAHPTIKRLLSKAKKQAS